ncbi:MAG: hypothetical protein IKD72_03945, partial [Clostridia bacterium]|nr:hypothetical protein [Clostridia bacterium]
MKRKWHIKTHLLVTLVGLTTALLLTVALAFNLSMYGYLRSRVTAQLFDASQSASEERRGDMHGPRVFEEEMADDADDDADGDAPDDPEDRFDERPDRVMGTRGSAVLLNADGTVFANLHGDAAAAQTLSGWYRTQLAAGKAGEIINKLVLAGNGAYVVSAGADPVTPGQIMLTYVDVTSVVAFARQIN